MPDNKKQRIDLTDKNALVSAFKKEGPKMWDAFGTPPLYKDFKVTKVIDYIEDVIKKYKVHISPEKKDEIFTVLNKYGNNVNKAMQYIANVFLKGAGLGLNEDNPDFASKINKKQQTLNKQKSNLNTVNQKSPGDANKKQIAQSKVKATQANLDTLKLQKKQKENEDIQKLRKVIREEIRKIMLEASSIKAGESYILKKTVKAEEVKSHHDITLRKGEELYVTDVDKDTVYVELFDDNFQFNPAYFKEIVK